MKKLSNRQLFFAALLLPGLAVSSAHANCTVPTGVERDFIYNGPYHTPQFCNGTNWVVAGGTVAPEAFNQIIGYANSGAGNADTDNANSLITMPYTLPYPGTIQSFSIYVTTAAGHVIMGIYDASGTGGAPNVLKATTISFTPTTGWNTVNVVTPVWLPAGNYWLAWNSDNNSLVVAVQNELVMQNGAYGVQDVYTATYGALPNPPSGAINVYQSTDVFYATFTGAGCASPTGKERDIFYNTASHTLQFCNGDMWISMGQGSGGGGGGCSNPAGKERDIIYNGDFHTYQFCNGTNWVKYGGKLWQGTSPTASTGYFVMSKSTWTGNLGGMTNGNSSATDALCLTELTTNTGWKGYGEALADGKLVSGNVHAFICENEDAGNCGNLTANTIYYFANANNSTIGGSSFTTDGSGQGPYNSADWSTNSYFGGTYSYWADRSVLVGTYAQTAFPTNAFSSGDDCTGSAGVGWNSAASGKNGESVQIAPGYIDNNRWYTGGNTTCNTPENLICFVNP